MSTDKKSLFIMDDGKNLIFTFILVSSLFLLWGFCNGMIDVMDKHFQDELGLTKSQSAWVQFAHYLGYFLMAMPAGWLASQLGYKGGIIAGLLMVAVGGFWFIPATQINALVHAGSVSPDHGLRRLPRRRLRHCRRTDLPGDRSPIPTRPCSGPRAMRPRASTWPSPATASAGFSARSSAACSSIPRTPQGSSTGSETLYIPYVDRRRRGLVLAVVFYFAYVPDIKTEDDYHLDDSTPGRLAFHLDSSALRAGGRRPVSLRRRPGRHLQLLHQLHDRRSSRRFPRRGRSGSTKNWIEVQTNVRHGRHQGSARARQTS